MITHDAARIYASAIELGSGPPKKSGGKGITTPAASFSLSVA